MSVFRQLAALLGLAALLAGPAAAKPAGYIVSWTPDEGAIAERAAVLRNGDRLTPTLLMPLQPGDSVAVEDGATTVYVEGAGRKLAAADSKNGGVAVTGELTLADEAVSLAARLEAALARPAAVPPAGSGGLAVPMAFDGQNFLVADGGPVYLAWSGGEAPYSLIFDIDGRRKELATTQERQIGFDIPALPRNRFSVVIKDRKRERVRVDFHIRQQLPAVPDAIAQAPVSPEFGDLLVKAWLAQRLDGMWRTHVIRLLRNSPAQSAVERRLLAHLEAGGGL
jgi:hypothetical protein